MPPFALSAPQRRTLRALCDTFIPALPRWPDPEGFWGRAASDLQLAEAVEAVIGMQGEAQQAQFRQLLDLLGSPLAAVDPRGPWQPFHAMTLAERTTLLQRWASSPIPLLRQGFQGLKRVTTLLYYALAEEGAPNPNWPTIGYPGPLRPPPDSPRPIEPLTVTGEILTCDVVVVGSGAGGGVVAGELAAAGQAVIVVEKGPYVAEGDFTLREVEAMATMYEAGGTMATADLGVAVLAGSCLGGGTTINWAAAFRTPDYILDEWARAHLLPHLLTPAFQQSLDAVSRATDVDTEESTRNPQNQALWEGCQARAVHVAPIPRNVRDCDPQLCGFCCFGCQRGAKQSTLVSYLQQANEAGARFLVNTTVHRVLVEGGQAVGVLASQRDEAGRPHPVTIRARRVVVAAGSLHTPALLRRSGLSHPHIGQHLHFHPTVAVSGLYPQRMEPWEGVMMAAVSDEWGRLDGNHGFKLETPPAHAGMMALALPWQDGAQHKAAMAQASHLGNFIVLVRDRDSGCVTVDKHGQPILHYHLSDYDRRHLLRGIQEAARIHCAAGATRVLFPHGRAIQHEAATGEAALERLLAGIKGWGWGPNHFPLFSAHQMGSCRMGGDAARHPVTPDGETREVRGLFIADASVFPSASGVNPMLTIQALAHHTAQGLK